MTCERVTLPGGGGAIKLTWREKHRMQVLHLGEIEVARVCRNGGGRSNGPRWLFVLDTHTAFWHSEKTIEKAMAAAEAKMQGWLVRAGLAHPPASPTAEVVEAASKLVEALERDQHYFGDEYEALRAALAKVRP